MITRINESKALAKHISCGCKCKFNGKICNSNQKWNNEKCRHECKIPIKHRVYKDSYVWNPSTCDCEIIRYLKSIVYDLVSTCDEITDVLDTVSINLNYKKSNM